MSEKEHIQLNLSVHQLVDFLLRKGDIDNRIFNRTSMSEGSKIHSYYQSRQGDNYLSEYPLLKTYLYDNYEITLQGRADGIIINDDGTYTLDEIKTTVAELSIFASENKSWHLGQAKCYALMFMDERKIQEMSIRLTYFRQGHKDKLVDQYRVTYNDVKKYVYSLFESYTNFYAILLRKQNERNNSIKTLTFPFINYRLGQKKLAKYTYLVGKKGGRLFVQAPTGIGKTMSTLFPNIKLLEKNKDGRIFYLTAKNSGKESAYQAILILKKHGLKINEILITAKDKICFNQGKGCNPDECPFAIGYYNKIQDVLKESLLSKTDFDFQTIVDIALKNNICPFELELDLSLYCDIIICDYNYVFDPLVYMKRYFDEDASNYYLLIDEAHNLIERSKEMYSSNISFYNFKKAKKSLTKVDYKPIKRTFTKLNKMFKEYDGTYENGYTILNDLLPKTYTILSSFYNAYQDMSKSHHELISAELNDFFLDVNKFLKIFDYYSECFILYIHKTDKKNDLTINLVCLDASKFLKSVTNRVHSSIFFSATLSPFEYFADLLGGERQEPYLSLASPFPSDNLLLLIAPKISIKYANRKNTYQQVAEYIKAFVSHKIGNYLVFSPSYEYLENLSFLLQSDEYLIIKQEKEMDDVKKEEFLNNFVYEPKKTMVGLAVIGGAFSEGVDLVSDRLIGAVIIGVGMPKINFVSDQIAARYDNLNLPGKDYAYVNPGMNKVMQAVGRVIRSENDRGAVLLIDERYTLNKYQDLFKEEWKNYKIVFNCDDIDKLVSHFFKK